MDTIITSMDARTQPVGVEGKDYSIIYDHNGKLVKYWHASHVIHKPEYLPLYESEKSLIVDALEAYKDDDNEDFNEEIDEIITKLYD